MSEQNEKDNIPAEQEELFQYEGYTPKEKAKQVVATRSVWQRLIPVFILVGVAVLLGGAILTMKFLFPSTEDPDRLVNTVTVLDADAADVSSMKVQNAKDSYTLVKKAGSVYNIVGKEHLAADSSAILEAIKKLCDIETTKEMEIATDKLSDYGLDTPQATVELATKKETFALYLGIKAPSDDYYYARLGDGKVFIMEAEQAAVLLSDRYAYYETDVSLYDSSADQQKISPVVFGGKNATAMRMESTEAIVDEEDFSPSYMMVSPIKHAFSNSAMEEILALLEALAAAEPVCDDIGDASLEKYGLKEPNYLLTFGNNGEEMTIEFGKTQDSFIYLRRKGEGLIYKVQSSYAEVLGRNLAGLCDVISYMQDVDNVSGMKVSGMGKTYTIDMTGKRSELQVRVNGKDVNANLFADFYAHLIGIIVTEEAEKPRGDDPLVTVEVQLEDGGTDVLKYYAVNEMKCFFEVNGSGIFNVSRLSVEKILENAQNLYDGKEIIAEW